MKRWTTPGARSRTHRRQHPGGGAAAHPPEGLLRHQDLRAGEGEEEGGASAKKGGRRGKKKSFTIGRISTKQLCVFTRQLSTLQDAGLRSCGAEDPSRPVQAGVLKNSLEDVIEDIDREPRCPTPSPSIPSVRQALLQHDQGR